MEPRETPEALLRLVARAMDRFWIIDAPVSLHDAADLLDALNAEGLEVRPKALDEDINASEEGT
jgi:hypothetical protein